jgi:hypothetical protein
MLAPADSMAAMDCNSGAFRFADIMARVVCHCAESRSLTTHTSLIVPVQSVRVTPRS